MRKGPFMVRMITLLWQIVPISDIYLRQILLLIFKAVRLKDYKSKKG